MCHGNKKPIINLWCLCKMESYIILFSVKYPGILWTPFIPGKPDYIYNE